MSSLNPENSSFLPQNSIQSKKCADDSDSSRLDWNRLTVSWNKMYENVGAVERLANHDEEARNSGSAANSATCEHTQTAAGLTAITDDLQPLHWLSDCNFWASSRHLQISPKSVKPENLTQQHSQPEIQANMAVAAYLPHANYRGGYWMVKPRERQVLRDSIRRCSNNMNHLWFKCPDHFPWPTSTCATPIGIAGGKSETVAAAATSMCATASSSCSTSAALHLQPCSDSKLANDPRRFFSTFPLQQQQYQQAFLSGGFELLANQNAPPRHCDVRGGGPANLTGSNSSYDLSSSNGSAGLASMNSAPAFPATTHNNNNNCAAATEIQQQKQSRRKTRHSERIDCTELDVQEEILSASNNVCDQSWPLNCRHQQPHQQKKRKKRKMNQHGNRNYSEEEHDDDDDYDDKDDYTENDVDLDENDDDDYEDEFEEVAADETDNHREPKANSRIAANSELMTAQKRAATDEKEGVTPAPCTDHLYARKQTARHCDDAKAVVGKSGYFCEDDVRAAGEANHHALRGNNHDDDDDDDDDNDDDVDDVAVDETADENEAHNSSDSNSNIAQRLRRHRRVCKQQSKPVSRAASHDKTMSGDSTRSKKRKVNCTAATAAATTKTITTTNHSISTNSLLTSLPATLSLSYSRDHKARMNNLCRLNSFFA